jgi:hypothetical protein
MTEQQLSPTRQEAQSATLQLALETREPFTPSQLVAKLAASESSLFLVEGKARVNLA